MTDFSKMVLDAHTNPAQRIQQEADNANLPLNDYMDLHPEAGWEFDQITFDETRDQYAQIVAYDEAGEDDEPKISDKFVAAFATFILNCAAKESEKFLAVIRKHAPNVEVSSYKIPISQDYPIVLSVENSSDFEIHCTHDQLDCGFENSPRLEGWYFQHLAATYELSIDKKPHELGKDLLKFFSDILSSTQE